MPTKPRFYSLEFFKRFSLLANAAYGANGGARPVSVGSFAAQLATGYLFGELFSRN